jgi:hypothetical protein
MPVASAHDAGTAAPAGYESVDRVPVIDERIHQDERARGRDSPPRDVQLLIARRSCHHSSSHGAHKPQRQSVCPIPPTGPVMLRYGTSPQHSVRFGSLRKVIKGRIDKRYL